MGAVVCPGCHFRCAIEDYQCRRGEKLHAKWTETGELPERRRPGRGRGEGMPSIPLNDRTMHLLHIVGIALSDLADECGSSAPDRRALDCLMRHEGAASLRIIEGRTGVDNVDDLLEQGFIALCDDNDLYELTDAGRDQARTWEAQRKQAEAEFLGVLSENEKEQLHDLIMKVLEPGFKHRAEQGR